CESCRRRRESRRRVRRQALARRRRRASPRAARPRPAPSSESWPVFAMPSTPPVGVPPPAMPLPAIVEVVVPSSGSAGAPVLPVPLPPTPPTPPGAVVSVGWPAGSTVVVLPSPSTVVEVVPSVVVASPTVVEVASALTSSSPRFPGLVIARTPPAAKSTAAAPRISFSGVLRAQSSGGVWSGRRESNPHHQLGRLGL